MIIQNSLKVKSLKKSDVLKQIKKYEEEINLRDIECPNCHSKEYKIHGVYERNVVGSEAGEMYSFTIEIKRIRCQKCLKTHAIIPDFLIPHKQVVLKLYNKVIKTCYKKKNKIHYASKKYGIFRSLIRKWIKEIEQIEERLKVMFKNNQIKKVIERIDEKIEEKYYYEYRLMYPKNKKGYFYIYKSHKIFP